MEFGVVNSWLYNVSGKEGGKPIQNVKLVVVESLQNTTFTYMGCWHMKVNTNSSLDSQKSERG